MHDIPAASVQTCVTSPPYWGLRDYGIEQQIGVEESPDAYIENLINVFRGVRRILKPDGTLWLNLGDCYNHKSTLAVQTKNHGRLYDLFQGRRWDPSCKEKDLVGIPWLVAFALRSDGWFLRADIVWAKPNPMPESVTDRPTRAHEFIFLFSKQPDYYYDHEAILEQSIGVWNAKAMQADNMSPDSKAVILNQTGQNKTVGANSFHRDEDRFERNKRDVWTIPVANYAEAHFATYPEKLIEPCILAGSRIGDTVFDPFTGSGTTGAVSVALNRNFIGTELNPKYIEIAKRRIGNSFPLFAAESSEIEQTEGQHPPDSDRFHTSAGLVVPKVTIADFLSELE